MKRKRKKKRGSQIATKPPINTERNPEASLRLGQRAPARPPFSLQMRMPDWHVDADLAYIGPIFPPGSSARVPSPLFPEETVGYSSVSHGSSSDTPFIIPTFDEFSAPLGGWLGGPVPRTGPIAALAQAARNYNYTLYVLRLCHFIADHRVFPQGLAKQLHGPGRTKTKRIKLPPNPRKSRAKFVRFAQNAEEAWYQAALEINALLEEANPSTGLMTVYADMVQVNGYIISMRIVFPKRLNKKKRGQGHILEISGSSSHVSIDYPFSSTP